MFLIRQAYRNDFQSVLKLARLLDSYNLPADSDYIRRLLAMSEDSFAGALPRGKARYLFVLEAPGPLGKRPGPIVGCSLIIAKHGVPGSPHLWLELKKIEKFSQTLKTRRSHEVLQMGHTEDGPTEVGGLVVLPAFRGHPAHCGLQIGAVRFLYMGIHPDRFEPEVLIEYRGAMRRGRFSPFWEAIGRVFTGLSYARADRLSVENKEFILNLMPREPIYSALLPKSVQAAIGAVHPSARKAVRMAERQGFRRIPQIEPFDGGPYYMAPLKQIRTVRSTRPCQLEPCRKASGRLVLVGTETGGWFRAVMVRGHGVGGVWKIPMEAFDRMSIRPGDRGYVGHL